ncbi:MAG: four-carbon acid sugar kinase family protein [Pseudoflavonifractor capillosus]|uniref:four-carbon acid sugar kinase family protein n=1 Tax=Pseudoflavonifractor capillosus TaxID=106588 RepID=UPI0023F6D2FE|nr:four-carbon acid sugar kinase family protein [Pseudoflavonifractor capillosus]MCI5929124.1 four-carbon acid sugar kinase family protein [Pseudoflavonifractor capillosus]MDY4660776.1 four-carbon acid sugar kinase family protein [Pseudoflavonifractor capillosus]
MNRYLIVADDFTGANDTGVQLKRRGVPTSVVFSSEFIASEGSFVLDTESRALGPEEAAAAVRAGLKGVDLTAFGRVMKKVDSTLRGSVAAEIKAVDELYGSELVVFAPALPDLGRTTVGGVHLLKGIPITRTELAKDPKTPVTEDNITKLLEAVYDEPVTHISEDQVSAGEIDFSVGRVFTCDSATNADLRSVIQAAVATGKRTLWVGTAAMADHLLGVEVDVPPALAVVASVSAVSREQVNFAAGEGIPLVSVPIPELLTGEQKLETYVAQTVALLQEGKDAILASSASCNRAELDRSVAVGEKLNMTREQVSGYTQMVMGRMTKAILEQTPISGMFLTGGDTALGFFMEARSLGSSIVTEIAVGIPMMRLSGGPFAGLKVVTKAGAFGKEDAITFALRKLKEVIPE